MTFRTTAQPPKAPAKRIRRPTKSTESGRLGLLSTSCNRSGNMSATPINKASYHPFQGVLTLDSIRQTINSKLTSADNLNDAQYWTVQRDLLAWMDQLAYHRMIQPSGALKAGKDDLQCPVRELRRLIRVHKAERKHRLQSVRKAAEQRTQAVASRSSPHPGDFLKRSATDMKPASFESRVQHVVMTYCRNDGRGYQPGSSNALLSEMVRCLGEYEAHTFWNNVIDSNEVRSIAPEPQRHMLRVQMSSSYPHAPRRAHTF